MTAPHTDAVSGDLRRDGAGHEFWEVTGVETLPHRTLFPSPLARPPV